MLFSIKISIFNEVLFMDGLLKFDSPRTYRDTALAVGIGSKGATSMEYMKGKGIQGVDFVIPEKNLTAREQALYRLVLLVGGTGDLHTAEMARSIADITKGEDGSTIGIVALPFLAERDQSAYPFLADLESFKKEVDLLIVVSNDDLLRPDNVNSFIDLQEIAHHQIWLAAKTIMDVATYKGVVCVDMDDVRSFSNGPEDKKSQPSRPSTTQVFTVHNLRPDSYRDQQEEKKHIALFFNTRGVIGLLLPAGRGNITLFHWSTMPLLEGRCCFGLAGYLSQD
jgi:hypothetical protein